MTGLREFKNATARSKKLDLRIEALRERQGKKYPQKASSTTFPSKGELAHLAVAQTKVTAGVFDRMSLSADRLNLSKSEWLRQAIDYYLENSGLPPTGSPSHTARQENGSDQAPPQAN